MEYLISRISKSSQFIQIRLFVDCMQNESIHLQLAAWRPGRYEIANYAQKIRGFEVSFENKGIEWSKASKDLWVFQANAAGRYRVDYEFYCNQLDAGGCWSDDSMLYLNFTNCAFDIIGRSEEEIHITIDVPSHYTIATSLAGGGIFYAPSYQVLIDSPILCSPDIKQFRYQIEESIFNLWIYGEIHFDITQLMQHFENFTKLQISDFGEFPSKSYHFIYLLLPFPHYHGVEHAHSTVITYGPAEGLKDSKNMDRLMGVSSHELYHFWNVCRIRPKELLPYDLSKEVLLNTGLVLEGVTTYMGDWYLFKSGYYSLEDYLGILSKLIQRETDSLGWQHQSIVESSLDLWLDGYKAGIPDKKTNIYNRGALISFCFDVMLLEAGSSLSKVMREMWRRFGKTNLPYHLNDFLEIIKNYSNRNEKVAQFIHDFVFGRNDLLPILIQMFDKVGLELIPQFNIDKLLHDAGIRTDELGNIIQIHPLADAYEHLMTGDEIIEVQPDINKDIEVYSHVMIKVIRFSRELDFQIGCQKDAYYPKFSIVEKEATVLSAKWIQQ